MLELALDSLIIIVNFEDGKKSVINKHSPHQFWDTQKQYAITCSHYKVLFCDFNRDFLQAPAIIVSSYKIKWCMACTF